MRLLLTFFFLIPSFSWGEIKVSEHFEAWHSNTQVDDFDSTESYYSRTYGDKDSSLVVYISKNPDYDLVNEITISPKDHICGNEGNFDYAKVSLRVDDNKVITENFSLSNNKQYLSNWEDDFLKEIIVQMKQGVELKIRIFDEICGDINDYKFSLAGFTKSLNYWENKFPKSNLGEKLLSLKDKVYKGQATIDELLLLEENFYRLDGEYNGLVDANLTQHYFEIGDIKKAEMNSFLYIAKVDAERLPYNKELFFVNFEVFLDSFLISKDKKNCPIITAYNIYRDNNDFRKNLDFPEHLLKKLSKADKGICN